MNALKNKPIPVLRGQLPASASPKNCLERTDDCHPSTNPVRMMLQG